MLSPRDEKILLPFPSSFVLWVANDDASVVAVGRCMPAARQPRLALLLSVAHKVGMPCGQQSRNDLSIGAVAENCCSVCLVRPF